MNATKETPSLTVSAVLRSIVRPGRTEATGLKAGEKIAAAAISSVLRESRR